MTLIFLYKTWFIFNLNDIDIAWIPHYYVLLICIVFSVYIFLRYWYLWYKARLWMPYFVVRSPILERFMISFKNLFRHLTKLFKENATTLLTFTFIFIYLILIYVRKIKIISFHSFFLSRIRPKKQINPLV